MNILKIALVIILAVFIQVMCIFADSQDTPNKALVEFASDYFAYDPDMADLLCEDYLIVDDVDQVKAYIAESRERAESLGYGLWYMSNYLYHVKTETIEKDWESATVHIEATIKNPVRNFFKGDAREIAATVNLAWDKEDRRWKVCDDITTMFEE